MFIPKDLGWSRQSSENLLSAADSSQWRDVKLVRALRIRTECSALNRTIPQAKTGNSAKRRWKEYENERMGRGAVFWTGNTYHTHELTAYVLTCTGPNQDQHLAQMRLRPTQDQHLARDGTDNFQALPLTEELLIVDSC